MHIVPDFEVGNIVKLISGGVPMTVQEVYDTMCSVIWMDLKGEMRSTRVYKSVLRHLNDEEYQWSK